MTNEEKREDEALAILREMLELLERHPVAVQYARLAGLAEPRVAALEKAARRLVAKAPIVDVRAEVVR